MCLTRGHARDAGVHVAEAPGRTKRSSYYDDDVLLWLRERGERTDRSVDWQVRQILRDAMNAERTDAQEGEDAA